MLRSGHRANRRIDIMNNRGQEPRVSRETNWAGNHAYRAATIHRPATIEALQEIVVAAPRIRGLGTRHAFNDLADSAELVSLAAIDPDLRIDREAMTVTAGAAMRYGELAEALEREGLALHNMGSLPHISIGGATATATHGSGDTNGNLATAVAAIEFVASNGEIVTTKRGDADFPGMVVHLGALGIATRLTLDVQPSYLVCQEVLEGLPWDDLEGDFDGIFSSAYSVSIFTSYAETADVLWLKHRLQPGETPRSGNRWRATAATAHRHPVADLPADACTDQLLEPWSLRLPHFRLDQVPASGEEIQTEYMVDRAYAVDVIEALRAFAPQMRDLLMISEIRSIAGDDLWLSTAAGRDTVGFHFSWYRDQEAVDRLVPKLDDHLGRFAIRPHWGKVFHMDADVIAGRYPEMAQFRALVERMDPRGAFRNDYIDRKIFG
jgi:xylitol oxidase